MSEHFVLRAPTPMLSSWIDEVKAFYCVGDLSMPVRSSCFARGMKWLRRGNPRMAKAAILELVADYAETRKLHDWSEHVKTPKRRKRK